MILCCSARQKLTARLCPQWKLRSKSRRALTDDEAKDLIDEITNLVNVFGQISQSDTVLWNSTF